MRKWMVWLGVIIIIAAAGGGAYYYFVFNKENKVEAASTATTVRVTRGDIVNQISGTGSVAANSRETVTAGKSGTIATVNVAEGDTVKAGDVIATFEDTDNYDDQIEEINNNIEKLKEEILDYQESYKEATGTENEEETKKSLEKSIEDANDQIADYQEDLQDIYEEQSEEVKQIVAPINGQVTDLSIEVGDEVEGNTTVVEIVDYDYLEFTTTVDETDITSVKVGQTADITLSSFTDKTFAGTVSEIAKEGTSSNGSSSFEVSILLTDKEGVMVGMSGEAAITIESKENVLLVPVNAVVEAGGKSYVRVSSGETGGAAAGEAGAAAGEDAQQGTSASGRTSGSGSDSASAGQRGTGQTAQGAASGEAGGSAGAESAASGAAQAGAASEAGKGGAQGAAPEQSAAGGESGGDTAASGGDGSGQAAAETESGAGNQRALQRIDTLGGKLVEVTTGLSNDAYVEIVSGLEEGQQVLVPLPQGEAGMGEESTQQTQQFMFPGGSFPGGGTGGNFSRGTAPGGGMSGGMR